MSTQAAGEGSKTVMIIFLTIAGFVALIFGIDLLFFLIARLFEVDDYSFGAIINYTMSLGYSLIPFVFYCVGYVLVLAYDYTLGLLFNWSWDVPSRPWNAPAIEYKGLPLPTAMVTLPSLLGEGKKKLKSIFRPKEQLSKLYICEV